MLANRGLDLVPGTRCGAMMDASKLGARFGDRHPLRGGRILANWGLAEGLIAARHLWRRDLTSGPTYQLQILRVFPHRNTHRTSEPILMSRNRKRLSRARHNSCSHRKASRSLWLSGLLSCSLAKR